VEGFNTFYRQKNRGILQSLVFEFFVQFLDACKAFCAEKAVLKASAMLPI
jgi:hypothetical protein